MTTLRARRPRDGSKIDLPSLHTRFNQVSQICQCLRIAIESKDEDIEPAEVCRAIVDMLDDINSDLWTFLEPAATRRTILLRKSAREACAAEHEDGVPHMNGNARHLDMHGLSAHAGNGSAGAGEIRLGNGANGLDGAIGLDAGELPV
ncbi:MAG: hypothetical protein WB440_15705 [Steroidobacteraceae bacterium]|jgi:hypothetical protein